MWADDVLLHLHQVGTQLDIFTKSQASACTNKRSVLKKEMTTVHLAERLANVASEQELWTSYPLGAQEARVPDFHADSALRYTLSPRPFARCVAADWPLRGTNSNGRFTELAYSEAAIFGQTPPDSPSATSRGSGVFPPRWHQQRSFAVVGPAGRPRSASNWSRTRPLTTGTRPTGTGPLLPPSARAALDWDRSRSPFFWFTS